MFDKRLVFIWEQFGCTQVDRIEAVAENCGNEYEVIGIELAEFSDTYEWLAPEINGFKKITLFPNTSLSEVTFLRCFWKTIQFCVSQGRAEYFFCHYEKVTILLTAAILRMLGCRVYILYDSKYDDKKRSAWRGLLKSYFFLPYNGAMCSSKRARSYLEYLGFFPNKITTGFDTLSVERIRRLSGAKPAPEGVPFRERHFTIIARHVSEENLSVALEGYAIYARNVLNSRLLHLIGSGELTGQLRARAERLGIGGLAIFRGVIDDEEFGHALASSLCLLLVGVEEQFGVCVIEAQAMGLPVIVSLNCGCRDELVRSGVNGFLVEPDNPSGIAFFLELIGANEKLWRQMAEASRRSARLGDSFRFAMGVRALISAGMSRTNV